MVDLDGQVRLLVGALSTQVKSLRTALGLTVPAVRKGYRSFGGATNTGSFGSITSQATRTRFRLDAPATRYRVHIRNYLGLSDFAPAGTGPTIQGVYVGPQDLTTPWDTAGAATQVGTAAGAPIQGLTEYVTPWVKPTYDMAKIPSLISIGYTMPSGATNIVYGNGSHSISIDDATKATSTVGTTYTVGGGTTNNQPWYDYNYTVLEMWIEYEFADQGNAIGLLITHSLGDGTSFAGGNTPGWDGLTSAYAAKHARRTGDIITVNGFATSKLTDWTPTSTKWNRFADLAPDYIVVDLTANDITAVAAGTNTTTAANTILTNLSSVLGTIRSKWPGTAVYVATCVPIAPNDTSADHEAIRQLVNAGIGALPAYLVAGVVDFDAAVRVGGPGTAWTPALIGADNQHANPRGHDKLAEAITLSRGSGAATVATQSGISALPQMQPAVGAYLGPQGVTNTAVANVTSLNTLWAVPYTVGPQSSISVDGVGFMVTTAFSATSTVLNAGVYGSNADGSPNLSAQLAAGTLSLNAATASTTVPKTLTFTNAATLAPGQYWLVVCLTGTQPTAGQMYCISQTAYSLGGQAGYTSATAKFLTGTNAGLPTGAVALTASTATSCPHFMLHRSA